MLDMGNLKLELVFFGKGHSTSDTLVYIPQERLLVTGAIVYQRRHLPEIGEESELQDIHRFLALLDEFLDEGVKINHVVPSHSPPLRQNGHDINVSAQYYLQVPEQLYKEVSGFDLQHTDTNCPKESREAKEAEV